MAEPLARSSREGLHPMVQATRLYYSHASLKYGSLPAVVYLYIIATTVYDSFCIYGKRLALEDFSAYRIID
jgi:hypothetical protein